MSLVGAASPEPVAEILHHQHAPRPAHISPPQYNHQQPMSPQHIQQQRQQQMYMQQPINQRQPDPKQISQQQQHRPGPNSDSSPYSSRQTASSTLVYSSQPNAYGITLCPPLSSSWASLLSLFRLSLFFFHCLGASCVKMKVSTKIWWSTFGSRVPTGQYQQAVRIFFATFSMHFLNSFWDAF